MPYSITCSTKILTLAIAPFLFIFISIICEFTMVPGRYILLSSQKEEVHYSFWGHRCTHSVAYSTKRFKSLLHHVKVVVEMEKNTNKKFSCFMVLILRPSSTLKFQFASGVNECFWEFFSLLFWKIQVLYLSCGCLYMTFDFMTQLTSSHLLLTCGWIKNLSAKITNTYCEMLRKICKRKV